MPNRHLRSLAIRRHSANTPNSCLPDVQATPPPSPAEHVPPSVLTVDVRLKFDRAADGWTATCASPVVATAFDTTYRRACGRIQRIIESALEQRVILREALDCPPELGARIAAFKAQRQEIRLLQCALRAEARKLTRALDPERVALSSIARELGLSVSELATMRSGKELSPRTHRR